MLLVDLTSKKINIYHQRELIISAENIVKYDGDKLNNIGTENDSCNNTERSFRPIDGNTIHDFNFIKELIKVAKKKIYGSFSSFILFPKILFVIPIDSNEPTLKALKFHFLNSNNIDPFLIFRQYNSDDKVDKLLYGLIKVEYASISFQLYNKGKVVDSKVHYFELSIEREIKQEINEQIEQFVKFNELEFIYIFGEECGSVELANIDNTIIDRTNNLYFESIMDFINK